MYLIQIAELTSALSSQHHQTSLLQEKVAGYKASLDEAHDTTRVTLEEKQSVQEQKDLVDARLVELQKRVCGLETELESGQERERCLETKIERLNEVHLKNVYVRTHTHTQTTMYAYLSAHTTHTHIYIMHILTHTQARSTLQTRLSEQQTELHETHLELEQLTAAHSKAVAESEEARGLWENEVKSKSKLGMKVIELERTHTDTNKLVDAVSICTVYLFMP